MKAYNPNGKKIQVGIIDYGVGNVFSVMHAIQRLGENSFISNDENKLRSCTHLILPGVGAFDEAFFQLNKSGLIPFLEESVFDRKIPILGICVGMQLMLESSTENGLHKGLGWVKGVVEKIQKNSDLKLPHVGWNNIEIKVNTLFQNVEKDPYFYFDHSYYCSVYEPIATSIVKYPDELISSFSRSNLFGVQFHPEKSQINGLRVFKSFLHID